MKKSLRSLAIAGLCVLVFTVAGFAQQDTLAQISTIDALLAGLYDGQMTLGDLKQYGNFGLGTFHALDGEMLALDGHIYQIGADGVAREPALNLTTPFAAVTFFETDTKLDLETGTNFHAFEKAVDAGIPTANIFYAIKVEGLFKTVKTRSVPKQKKPYPLLKEIAKTQPIFHFENVEGTLVGFRCPQFVKGINVPGFHLHFITRDRKAGGHVLDFTVQKAVLRVDHTSAFLMILPKDKSFYKTDFGANREAELKAVETE